jgi:hypothetical protein
MKYHLESLLLFVVVVRTTVRLYCNKAKLMKESSDNFATTMDKLLRVLPTPDVS